MLVYRRLVSEDLIRVYNIYIYTWGIVGLELDRVGKILEYWIIVANYSTATILFLPPKAAASLVPSPVSPPKAGHWLWKWRFNNNQWEIMGI